MSEGKVTKTTKNHLKGVDTAKVEFRADGMVVFKPKEPDGKGFVMPRHIYDLAAIVNNNYDIRRYTALCIISEFKDMGEIEPFANNCYVDFFWNKFTVIADGIRKQYTYREDVFLKALQKAFELFAKQAENNMSVFIDKEDKLYAEKIAKLQAKHSIADKVKPVDSGKTKADPSK